MEQPKDDRETVLRKRRNRIDAQLDSVHNRKIAQARADDTRRKILLGAVVMKAMKASPDRVGAWAQELLAEELKRPKDRALWGLPPIATVGVGTLQGLKLEPGQTQVPLRPQPPEEPLQPTRPTTSPNQQPNRGESL